MTEQHRVHTIYFYTCIQILCTDLYIDIIYIYIYIYQKADMYGSGCLYVEGSHIHS